MPYWRGLIGCIICSVDVILLQVQGDFLAKQEVSTIVLLLCPCELLCHRGYDTAVCTKGVIPNLVLSNLTII